MLPFAKRGDDRGNNLIRLQQMFPRIVAADFQQPLHVSKECQHLLSRMLTPDPARRITIGEIMQHQWCARLLWLAAGRACANGTLRDGHSPQPSCSCPQATCKQLLCAHACIAGWITLPCTFSLCLSCMSRVPDKHVLGVRGPCATPGSHARHPPLHARRFLDRLPPHMQHLNYTLVQTLVPVGLQSVEEIETIVHQATRPTTWPKCAHKHMTMMYMSTDGIFQRPPFIFHSLSPYRGLHAQMRNNT